MYDLLVILPLWLQVLAATGLAGLLSVVATAMLRKITAVHRRESHNEVIGLVFTACGILYSVLLALEVSDANRQYEDAHRIPISEATTLVALYYDTESYPAPLRSAMQEAIRHYTRAVADDEFPSMSANRSSPVVAAQLNQLYLLNSRFQPSDPYSALLKRDVSQRIDRIAMLRAERLGESQQSLSPVFWSVLILGGAVTIVLGAALFMQRASHQLFGSFLLGVMIGAVLLLLLLLDRPFAGPFAIHPDPFRRSLELYAQIDALSRQATGPPIPSGAIAW